jgi:hypothetical protein
MVASDAMMVIGFADGGRLMLRRFGVACVLGLSMLGNAGAASAPGQIKALPQQDMLLQTSFFGRPYPYGYTGWARCTRYVEVQTHSGTHLRRIRVCR